MYSHSSLLHSFVRHLQRFYNYNYKMKSHLIFLAIFIHQLLNPKVSAQVGDNLEHEILSKHLLPEGDVLSLSYYEKSCPNVEAIIHKKVNAWIEKDYTLAASLIRLHFHDCAIRVSKCCIYCFLKALSTSNW